MLQHHLGVGGAEMAANLYHWLLEARLLVQLLHSKDVLCSTVCYSRGSLRQQPVPGSCTKRSHMHRSLRGQCCSLRRFGGCWESVWQLLQLKYISAVLSLLPAFAGTGPGN